GLVWLWLVVNALSALLAAFTLLSYLLLYTPLKTRTWLCTLVGAVPGAIPPMIGWAAVTGRLDLQAWALFAIIFFWQLPPFYAIGWMYREDYARAGFPMLPVIDAQGSRTSRQAWIYSLLLLAASAGPALGGLAGRSYLVAALALGVVFLVFG